MEFSSLLASAPSALTAVVQLSRPIQRGAESFLSVLASAMLPPDSEDGKGPKGLPDERQAQEALRSVHGRLVNQLRAAGIDVSQPLELLVRASNGTVAVIGPHADGEAAERVFQQIPQLGDLLRTVAARDVFAVTISDESIDVLRD